MVAPTTQPSPNGGSFVLAMGSAPPEVAIAQVEQIVGVLEGCSALPDWQERNPAKFAAYRAYVRMLLAALDYLAEAHRAGLHNLTAAQSAKLEEVRERASDLIDTLAWAAEAPAELAALAEAAT